MKKKRTNKDFDCIKFKRQIQTKIYGETKNMTAKEQIVYLQEQAESGPLGDWWKSLQNMPVSRKSKQRNKSKANVYALKEKQG